MDDHQVYEGLTRILQEFLSEYSAASEASWQKHRARNGSDYMLPSKGRFFTVEEREAFAAKAGQYRAMAEALLDEAGQQEPTSAYTAYGRKLGFAMIREAISCMTAEEAERGRWTGNYPQYVEHLLARSFPCCSAGRPDPAPEGPARTCIWEEIL